MKKPVISLLLLVLSAGSVAGQSDEALVRTALQAAPEDRRGEATVLSADGQRTLKRGSNDLICLAPDPGAPTFSTACYHDSLEAYMARGRALVREGVSDPGERNRIRWEEADAGDVKLALLDAGAGSVAISATQTGSDTLGSIVDNDTAGTDDVNVKAAGLRMSAEGKIGDAQTGSGTAATTTVGRGAPPGGAEPPVTVTRSQHRLSRTAGLAITAAMPASTSWRSTGTPAPSPETTSRSRWRRRAKVTPSTISMASKTP